MQIKIEGKSGHSVPATLEHDQSKGHVVVLSHGIFVDRSENGRFDRLAAALASTNAASVRMDLAGHGLSEVQSKDATVESLALDLRDVIKWAQPNFERVSIVASSFSGGLLSLLSDDSTIRSLSRVVLWNPVLDLRNVFTEAEMPEMAEMFSTSAMEELDNVGYFYPVPHFQMSQAFVFGLNHYDVAGAYSRLRVPHLVLHGSSDELVSFEHASSIVQRNKSADLKVIEGGVHAFSQSGHEPKASELTVRYLTD